LKPCKKKDLKKRPGDWFCPACFTHNIARNAKCSLCGEPKDVSSVVHTVTNEKIHHKNYYNRPPQSNTQGDINQDTQTKKKEPEKTRCPLDWIYCNGACITDPTLDLFADVMEGAIAEETEPLVKKCEVIIYDQNWKIILDKGLSSLGLLSEIVVVNYNKRDEIRKKMILKKVEKRKEKELRSKTRNERYVHERAAPPQGNNNAARKYVHVDDLSKYADDADIYQLDEDYDDDTEDEEIDPNEPEEHKSPKKWRRRLLLNANRN